MELLAIQEYVMELTKGFEDKYLMMMKIESKSIPLCNMSMIQYERD
jgi:hypothetical protein